MKRPHGKKSAGPAASARWEFCHRAAAEISHPSSVPIVDLVVEIHP